jgi:hypothetical protein
MGPIMAIERPYNYQYISSEVPEFGAVSIRRAENRRRTSQSMSRATSRRRLLSGAAIGVFALLGTGFAFAGIQRTFYATPVLSSPTTTTPSTLVSAYGALRSVSLALNADQRTIAKMLAETSAALRSSSDGALYVPSPVTTYVNSAPPSAAATPPAAPVTHASTGASGLG